MLPPQPRLMDLGAGSGSLFRWLAPIIGGPQQWLWLDDDPTLLAHGLHYTRVWARRLDYRVMPAPDGLVVVTPRGDWCIRTRVHDLHRPPASLPLADADAVACSALLDLFPAGWLAALLGAIAHRPFYAAMSVTAHDRIRPGHRDDALVWRGYVHALRTGPAEPQRLGSAAPPALRALSREHGLHCAAAASDWIIHPRHQAMLQRMIGFVTGGARLALPQHAHRIGRWERRRRREAAEGRLSLRIRHQDLLVLSDATVDAPAREPAA